MHHPIWNLYCSADCDVQWGYQLGHDQNRNRSQKFPGDRRRPETCLGHRTEACGGCLNNSRVHCVISQLPGNMRQVRLLSTAQVWEDQLLLTGPVVASMLLLRSLAAL